VSIYLGIFVGVLINFAIPTIPARNAVTLLWKVVGTCVQLYLTVGRFHNINKSGWFTLVPIYQLIVPLAMQGDAHDNRFGPPAEQLSPTMTKVTGGLLVVALAILLPVLAHDFITALRC
jgi:uncharacterized membrane protein YhaH (DUF805 family)